MPSRLRIGVNALYLIPGGVGGTEIYLRNLLAALARIDRRNQYWVYVNRETGPDLCPVAPNFAPIETDVKASFRPGRLLWEQTRLALDTFESKPDILFSPGFTSPRLCRGRKVTVIHDLQHRRQPKNFGFFERAAWEWSVKSSVRSSERLIAVSRHTKAEITEVYGTPPERIDVVPHGVEPDFFGLRENEAYEPSIPTAAGLPDGRYLLAVSTLHPHKNWDRLLAAYKHLADDGLELNLAVCGLPGKHQEAVRTSIAEMGLSERVHLLGWQPRRTLIGLFKFADALVFPSTFEGFGMPVLEALAAGLPVVCSDIPPLREIADGAACFVDPHSADSIAEGVRATLADPKTRGERVRAGLERAAGATWERAAERTLAAFLEAARG